MRMHWLHRVTDSIAAEIGADAEALRLSPSDVRTILDVARIAAHTSGDRTNAPLLCYVLGLARSRGASLERIAQVVDEIAEVPT